MPFNDPSKCPHAALTIPKSSGEFSDSDARLYVCLACGFPVLGCPANKFKDNTEALAFFARIAEEIILNLPKIPKSSHT